MINNTPYLSSVADQLGEARAELKYAQDRVKELESVLKQSGQPVVEGDLFRVKIAYNVETKRVDWKSVAAKLNPSRQLIAGNTKVSTYDRLSISAQPKAQQVAA